MLIGVDDMDVFKGIELKLQAVERVLDHHPEWRGRLVLLQVTNAPRCAPRRSRTYQQGRASERSLASCKLDPSRAPACYPAIVRNSATSRSTEPGLPADR